jgi:hypothetical protein
MVHCMELCELESSRTVAEGACRKGNDGIFRRGNFPVLGAHVLCILGYSGST